MATTDSGAEKITTYLPPELAARFRAFVEGHAGVKPKSGEAIAYLVGRGLDAEDAKDKPRARRKAG